MTDIMLDLVESLRAEEASIPELFGDAGTRIREHQMQVRQVLACANFIQEVESGKRPLHHLKEAMTRSDFPLLMADTLDRQMLGAFIETPPTWQAYCKRSVLTDFRPAKRFATDGAESVLPKVGERDEYKESPLTESKDELSVEKYGRKIDLSWEAMVNDDLGAFLDIPNRLARAARRSENKFATELFVDSKGPHASLYKAEFKNIIEKNPVLDVVGLQKGMLALSEMKDLDGEPIVVDAVTLVVPPALEVTANNILHALQIETNEQGGSEKQRLLATNWMKNRVSLQVEPYIPVVASAENGSTSWFLFASPQVGRPALEMGFLRGYEEPSLFEKAPDARRVGGGDVMESFDNDSVKWRVRHVLGGTRLTSTGGYKSTVASSGKGA